MVIWLLGLRGTQTHLLLGFQNTSENLRRTSTTDKQKFLADNCTFASCLVHPVNVWMNLVQVSIFFTKPPDQTSSICSLFLGGVFANILWFYNSERYFPVASASTFLSTGGWDTLYPLHSFHNGNSGKEKVKPFPLKMHKKHTAYRGLSLNLTEVETLHLFCPPNNCTFHYNDRRRKSAWSCARQITH